MNRTVVPPAAVTAIQRIVAACQTNYFQLHRAWWSLQHTMVWDLTVHQGPRQQRKDRYQQRSPGEFPYSREGAAAQQAIQRQMKARVVRKVAIGTRQ